MAKRYKDFKAAKKHDVILIPYQHRLRDIKVNPEQIEFNKILGKLQKDASIKACLRCGDEQLRCSGKVIHAHSIQRGKILESIADSSGENEGKIYHLGLVPAEDMQSMRSEFKLQGIKKFSTFTGFCSGHDKAIFQPIEDVAFSATTKQLHIYAYRAAAKELHTILESKNFLEALLGDKLNKDDFPPHYQLTLPMIKRGEIEVPEYILKDMLEGEKNHRIRVRRMQCEHSISELQKICNNLIDAIERDESPEFEHVYYALDGDFPIACNASFIAYFDHDGRSLISRQESLRMAQSSAARYADMKNVMLNVFPEGGQTHIIFTFSKGNLRFKASIQRLFKLKDEALKRTSQNLPRSLFKAGMR